MMYLYNLLLPVCILITGIMNIIVGINGLKQERGYGINLKNFLDFA